MRASNVPSRTRGLRPVLQAIIVCASLSIPATALAGEVVFGAQPLATDDSGKLTAEGRKATLKELPSEPGEEAWNLHVWAKIDKGGPGPLYVEFFGKLPDGKKYLAYRHEKSDYQGEKYVSMDIELDGSLGFNKGHTYDVEVSQLSPKGANIPLGSGKLTLTYTEAPPEEKEEGDEDTEGDTAKQDELDTLAGGDDAGAGGDQGGPPPVGSKGKKGCSVDPTPYGLPGVLVLFGLGALAGRRRKP